MKTILAFTLVLFSAIKSSAQTPVVVGIFDSGFYNQHEWLKDSIWTNPDEKADRIDNDGNSFVDDFHGWNFAEDNSFLFTPEIIREIPEWTFEIFEIIGRIQDGSVTQEDTEFLDREIRNQPEAIRNQRIQVLNFYGQYAHGTHVAGLVANPILGNSQDIELINLRMFPEASFPAMNLGIIERIENIVLKFLSQMINMSFSKGASYVHSKNAQVANLSLGVPLDNLAKQYLALRGNQNPSEAEIAELAQRIFESFRKDGENWIKAAPQTLFVIASGNSSLNNDIVPSYPASIRADNLISIAATKDVSELADFSNYGASTVDLAAPGVSLRSSVPGNSLSQTMAMSGTSMAAPYVSGIAARALLIYPSLDTKNLKTLLMKTVDLKPWLSGKVVSGGVVNPERVYVAAQLMKNGSSLNDAIKSARRSVPDQEETPRLRTNRNMQNIGLKEFANQFVF